MKTHKCENITCHITAEKDKYGNYKKYCSNECKKISRSIKIKETYQNKDMDAILQKRKDTMLSKYGVENASYIPAVKEKLSISTTNTAQIRAIKTKETNLARYGVESTNSLEAVQRKKKQTLLEKYGVDHQLKIPDVAAKVSKKNSENSKERLAIAAKTKEEKYGDENYNNRTKYVETCNERFGVDNPSQNAEVHEKKVLNGFKSKELILPSGKIIKVQGYEWIGIPILLETYTENEIIIGRINMPEIWYDLDGMKHRYFPDAYVPTANLIIEVKSQFRYDTDLHINLAKMMACIDQGYNYRFMICNESDPTISKNIDHIAKSKTNGPKN